MELVERFLDISWNGDVQYADLLVQVQCDVTVNVTPSTWISQNTPLWIQHSAKISGKFPILCASGLPHNASGIEEHHIRTGQHNTSHGQISDSDAKLFRHAFLGHHKISRQWNGPPHPQQRLLPVISWSQEQIGGILFPQHKIIGSQQGPTKSTPAQLTCSCQMRDY